MSLSVWTFTVRTSVLVLLGRRGWPLLARLGSIAALFLPCFWLRLVAMFFNFRLIAFIQRFFAITHNVSFQSLFLWRRRRLVVRFGFRDVPILVLRRFLRLRLRLLG